jgi:uncharacterized protein
MKIILDTNVLVSGIFFSGPPYRILRAWHDQRFQLVLSTEILDEYRRVASELSIKYPVINIEPFLHLIETNGLMVSAPPLSEMVCGDRDDDKFIACALAAECDIIVSGDKHLLKVFGYRQIKVLTPHQFAKEYL